MTKELTIKILTGDVLGTTEQTHEAVAMAVKALSALPSAQPEYEDAVSRKAVIDAIDKWKEACADNGHKETVSDIKLIRKDFIELPSVTPKQPGWIPWDSGRFPEESGTYTVTAYDGAKRRVTYAKYQKRLKRWELTGSRAYWRVLAWMPLPKPWEGGQDD